MNEVKKIDLDDGKSNYVIKLKKDQKVQFDNVCLSINGYQKGQYRLVLHSAKEKKVIFEVL